MTGGRLILPKEFDGSSMGRIISGLISLSPNRILKNITIDFNALTFIRPVGVTFLNNIIRWLEAKNVEVSFDGLQIMTKPIQYLDDSLFFNAHKIGRLRKSASPRTTTLPLQEIRSADSHMWLRNNLIPWLSSCINVPESSLSEIQTCVSEVFNNIKDHTTYDIGSIFAQHFPQQKSVVISISDFGRGIPESVRTVRKDIDKDADAISLAIEEGFTSKTTPRNRGAGLAYLMSNVVLRYSGTVTIYSGRAIVAFGGLDGAVVRTKLWDGGYSPGTTIEIEFKTDAISVIDDASEEFEW